MIQLRFLFIAILSRQHTRSCHVYPVLRTLRFYRDAKTPPTRRGAAADVRRVLTSVVVIYLAFADSKDMDMVLEYSDWVLDNFPERGLKIFATDLGEAEQWPRRRVFDHLARRHGDLCVPYLEHVIHVWNDTDGTFHDTLIRRYAELLRRHDRHSRTSSSETDRRRQVAPPSNTKRKLLAFLERSDHYSLERTLEQFPICDGNIAPWMG